MEKLIISIIVIALFFVVIKVSAYSSQYEEIAKSNEVDVNISFGNIINFEIKDNQLIAKIGGQISPAGGYIGDLLITYMFKDNMYQAKSIEFIPYEN